MTRLDLKIYIFAGHPEGNLDIDPDGSRDNVNEALSWKKEFSLRTDASIALTTQFCFDSKIVINWIDGHWGNCKKNKKT